MEEGAAIAIATHRRRQWLCFVIVCCAAHLATMATTGAADRSTPPPGGAASGNTPHVTETTPGGLISALHNIGDASGLRFSGVYIRVHRIYVSRLTFDL